MGSGGAKKTNAMLAEETAASRRQQEEAARRSAEIYGGGRGDIDWARGELKGLYSGLGAEGEGGGGGGGGPAFEKYGWESETMPFYRNLMGTGGISEQERGAMESSATAPVRGIFDALSRRLSSGAAGAGRYGAGASELARDAAYQASEANKGAFGDIAKLIAAGKERGAAGLTGLESEKRALELSERDKALAAARARASAGAGRAEDDLNTRRSLINQILGLEGDKDLAYMDRELAGRGQSIGSVTSRVDETPMWQKALASAIPAGASAAAGAFSGGLSNPFKRGRKETEGEKAGWYA